MSRDAVIARLRAAQGRGAPRPDRGHLVRQPRVAPEVRSTATEPLPPEDLTAYFADRARAVGTLVETAVSMSEAVDRVARLCAERAARRVAIWTTPDLTAITQRLHAAGIHTLGPDTAITDLAEADVGVTGADWVVAETATLVLASGPDQPRLTSLLPPVHVAMVRVDRILPDLPSLFARVGSLPRALTFITGPSRSADIGLVPVLGAHGPTEVIVVLVTG